ncbi:15-hydroxyprostaglandin dehydrogenase [NAD(+)] [Olea europaea subsp. europaea]|uniref:15-hydroxyprostaglandin dehydrogenase [NAD(+)] n=1 Tax=Olea europaea subsp. europaea TaxID=158383 RepID=A0A8S0Q1B6_OLEEU|nr:15-hydroxyprostaglandin dehydrogenase [NAD(+)] [Olea europaea subsp. europaea]
MESEQLRVLADMDYETLASLYLNNHFIFCPGPSTELELKPGLSALVTGGSSGIGKALVVALAQKGIFSTIIDLSEEKGKEVASLTETEFLKFSVKPEFPAVLFIKCDVTDTNEIKAAFRKHIDTYGGLDICINCAGIGSSIPFDEDRTDGGKSWRLTVNVNLIAVIGCTQIAIQKMQETRKPGVIINVASASGLYPLYTDPIYSGSKGGVILFTRSLALYKHQGIRINALCPEVLLS